MFEISQVKYNNFDYHIFLRPLIASLHAQILTQIKNVFACSKHSNLKSGQSLFFSNVFFFYKMCTIPSKNWRGF